METPRNKQMDLSSKIAIVTGGTKGIGYAISEALLNEGAAVFICGRSETELKDAIGRLSEYGRADGKVCDVRQEDQVVALLDTCVKSMGGIDILVNNAGVGYMGKTVEEMSGEEFRQTLETNLFGVFYACHHSIPHMKKRGVGYI